MKYTCKGRREPAYECLRCKRGGEVAQRPAGAERPLQKKLMVERVQQVLDGIDDIALGKLSVVVRSDELLEVLD